MRRALVGIALAVSVAVSPVAAYADGHPITDQAARDHGVSVALLECIIEHESEFDPYAVSPTDDYGLAQWHRPWDPNSLWQHTPYRRYSVFNAWANVQAAAWAISRGFGPHWATWPMCSS